MKQRQRSWYYYEEIALNRVNPERLLEEMEADEEERFHDKPFLKIVKKAKWRTIYKQSK